MCYSKSKVFLAIFMSIVMILSSTAFAGTKQGITYTALGDSVAFGTGATDLVGYTDLFNAHLTKVFGEGMYYNLSYNGATSDDLLMALQYQNVQAAVINSEIITISIGGNDLLGPFLEAFGGVILDYYWNTDNTVDFESLLTDLAEWEMDPITQPQFNMMLSDLLIEFPSFVYNFATNWGLIISGIRSLNPEADIYVNTVFNPLKFSSSLYDFADSAIQGLNLPIHYLASDFNYKVVDVYSNFEEYGNPKKLVVGDLSTISFMFDSTYTGQTPLHPTDLGYKFISNMHKDLMD